MTRTRRFMVLGALVATVASACIDPGGGGGGPGPGPGGPVLTRIASGGVISAAVISRNERYVAYVSTSTGLGLDGNGSGSDVFLIDRQTSVTTRVTGANGPSDAPSVADDGSVVFRSAATDLAGPDTNGHLDAFRWVAGTVTRITDSPGDVTPPLVSADGSTVVFGAPEALEVPAGTTQARSWRWVVATSGPAAQLSAVGAEGSAPVAVNGDGSRVLLAEPGRLSLHDGTTAVQIAAATPSPPAPAVTTFSVAPHAIADDGDVVFAETTYSYDDGSGVIIFTGGVARRWDAQSATVSTLGLTGAPAGPVISRNGRHVVYSDVTGVVVDQDAGAAILPGAIRSFDTTTGKTTAVAATPSSAFSTVSSTGRFVAFVSTDAAIVPGDPEPAMPDVYLWDRGS